ncbi:Relaxin-3 [Labeo rohita]|uniref:Relaxin-3 n=1 Tax=Labeo rohita TaxID=84645 RepID=A0ABQ8MWM3_LABRO|nr:insulin-like 5b [Labeo rohita]XP_050952991.1 insulin-like 5b [Labeo rohita]KAI2667248.1 Relaxin-3 [Labeo rohita]
MKVVLLVVLLVWAAWADSAQAQKALRLCGREFFRAVVYTCGGSRWRRGRNEDPINGYEIATDVESLTSAEMDRVRREAYEVLPSTCCTVGCRKSDLVRMC